MSAAGGGGQASPASHSETVDTAGTTKDGAKAKSAADSTNTKARKRTKTGCLTCRKRRIKCGEERPICNNCIKSKRHCEGYNQRVIFKPPIGDWPGSAPASTLPYHSGVIPGGRPVYQQPFPGPQAAGMPYGALQPGQQQYPLPQYGQFTGVDPFSGGAFTSGLVQDSSYVAQAPPYSQPMDPAYQQRSYSMGAMQPEYSQQLHPQPSYPSQAHRQSVQLPYHTTANMGQGIPAYSPTPQDQPYGQQSHAPQQTQYSQGFQYPSATTAADTYRQPHPLTQSREVLQAADRDVLVWQKVASGLANEEDRLDLLSPESAPGSRPGMPPQFLPDAGQTGIGHPPPPPSHQAVPIKNELRQSGFSEHHPSPTEALQEAAVEFEDDDYYDVQSDDEMELLPAQEQALAHGQQRDFEVMMQIHRDSVNELNVRHYNTFLYSGILDQYRAEQVANPLRNPQTARVFAHFIHATGPSLSIFERRVRNASAMFSERPVHPSQQSLWTYTLPMMALNHQGLLHSMLALSSLHIAKLQHASVTPSFKHYAYALKRVHHAVGHPKKRHHVTTLAACLMLGLYEVMTADHVKWNSHLLGAKQLFVEIDYAGMTKAWRKKKAEEDAFERNFAYENPGLTMQQPRYLNKEPSNLPDERVVSMLTGRQIRYDDFGKVFDDPGRNGGKAPEPDLTHYETYQDLWWWFVRHDGFQSVISGNGLLMDYTRWSDCPPRAPLGKPDALYGTHDHSLLLLGRIAEFASRDRERKIQAVQMNGGQWRPGLGMPGPPAGSGPPPGTQFPQGQRPGMPPQQGSPSGGAPPQIPFYGMAPSSSVRHMPSAFKQEQSPSPDPSVKVEDQAGLQAATQKALAEWQSMREALSHYASHLGPAFAPLSDEFSTPIPSPFGPALQYRSFDIAVLWAQYHMLEIILARSHPTMPPAAMMAAGVAAQQTAHWAKDIGRIVAGIFSGLGPHGAPLNPSIGAALIECIMPLFFAGIQYVDAAQRDWLVVNVKDIEARTGWASAGLVANGCQKVWERAGLAGRGPPYVYRREDPDKNPDERISGRKEERAASEGRSLTQEEEEAAKNELSDRRYIWTNPGTRVHWAMGILSEEQDLIRPPGV
ncbi:putative transcriptional regulatory protein C15D4.02 [Lasiodiplodia hormozganensis]|uniref:Transcriptional regulatory protein C15D4.02 n=1 Tax=Lasiodiplodia hormozganensis TaxID=869390 RepID=A0AA39YD23_9PEZI|nr:putative transcriptional regulatory protein C15D4.02 [Lasiodiplodia hormozganensis]